MGYRTKQVATLPVKNMSGTDKKAEKQEFDNFGYVEDGKFMILIFERV